MFVPFHPFLAVMIAVKETKSVSFLKLEPFILTGLTNNFLSFKLIICLHSVYFSLARSDKSSDFSPFHSIVHVHPPTYNSFRASLLYHNCRGCGMCQSVWARILKTRKLPRLDTGIKSGSFTLRKLPVTRLFSKNYWQPLGFITNVI